MLWGEMPGDVDVLTDELYGLPLDRFVPERDLLAKQLRADGRREDARRIAALTKPSVAAWAVNQVVRAQREAAARLWEAGDHVLAVQALVVAGEATGPDLRTAIEGERAALAPLADAARGLMTAAGKFLGEQNVQAVVESLHAAAIDPAARPQVASGTLTRPLRLTGLEAALASGAAPRPRGEATETARERLAERERDDAADEAERRRAEREQRARREEAQRALVRAEREREKARDRIAAAVRRRDEAEAGLVRARKALEAAESEHGAAEEALASAHDELEEAEEAVDRAREEVRAQ